MSNLGFVILSHNNPDMLFRLVSRLNRSFDHPPIACHHDLNQCPINVASYPRNVRFVPKPIPTQWGHISVVHAFRLALRLLYQAKSAPEWFIYLSGSDYPINSADCILQDLNSSPYDAYLDHRAIEYGNWPPGFRDRNLELGFKRPFWVKVAYDRYFAIRVDYPGVDRKFRPAIRRHYLRHPSIIPSNPFRDGTLCYAGDAWLTARAKCAELLLANDAKTQELLAYYAKKEVPEESLYHTVLCNAPGLQISPDNKRYTDWSGEQTHPKMLSMEYLEPMLASGHHFARKFSRQHDSRVLDELDRIDAVSPAHARLSSQSMPSLTGDTQQ